MLPKKALTPDQALQKMEHYCAYQERCPKEVKGKLAEMGLSKADAAQIYQVLLADKFFDETRFALAFAGGKFRISRWGRVRIRQELKMRDIAPEIIARALDSLEEREYEITLKQLLEKKYQQYQEHPQRRDKTIAALVRAGFELDLIFKYLPQR